MDNAKELGLYFGLRRSEVTPFDIINLSRSGIKASFAKKLIRDIQINQEEFAEYLGLKIRTLSRRFEKPTEKMTSEESEKVIRLARIFLESLDIFKNEIKVATWLKRPNRSLSDKAPISYLDSDIGAEEVMALLGRIRDGVYS
jgi:putative toxin-antitoxin system antitoxin component (TIGR02293 family)